MVRFLGLACILLALSFRPVNAAETPTPAPTAAPTIIRTVSRAEMLAVMKEAGMTALKDGTVDENGPWVEGKTANGVVVDVYFYQCEAAVAGAQRQCGQLSFRSAWTNPRAIEAKAVNVYNYSYVFGRGVISADGQQVAHDYPLNLAGGVTRDFIAQNLSYYFLSLNDFIRIVGP
jgi:hypothetical protein